MIDGSHRVSVARQLGAKTIEAYVTELRTPVPIDENTTEKDLIQRSLCRLPAPHSAFDVLRPRGPDHPDRA